MLLFCVSKHGWLSISHFKVFCSSIYTTLYKDYLKTYLYLNFTLPLVEQYSCLRQAMRAGRPEAACLVMMSDNIGDRVDVVNFASSPQLHSREAGIWVLEADGNPAQKTKSWKIWGLISFFHFFISHFIAPLGFPGRILGVDPDAH